MNEVKNLYEELVSLSSSQTVLAFVGQALQPRSQGLFPAREKALGTRLQPLKTN